MTEPHTPSARKEDELLALDDGRVRALLQAVESDSPVSGLTHRFYRYPARFSPEFAACVIETFTEPGDYVLDPFMGGGTSVVEALALGRRVAGCDINPLSGFLARVKSTVLGEDDTHVLRRWLGDLEEATHLRLPTTVDATWRAYQRNVPWWLRKTLELALASVEALPSVRARRFAKCSLMRTAQWALDCRAKVPTRGEFLERHRGDHADMLTGIAEFKRRVRSAFVGSRTRLAAHRRLLVRDAMGLDSDARLPREWGSPRLILTSPPYVGVHILYHRWQVRGRRETSAPYWLAGQLDGKPNSYYNFADRRQKHMTGYLAVMRATFSSIVRLMDQRSTLVQLVAFARPEEQLPAYLQALTELGLESIDLRLNRPFVSRRVPNRKWYADVRGSIAASEEFLLVHRKAVG